MSFDIDGTTALLCKAVTGAAATALGVATATAALVVL